MFQYCTLYFLFLSSQRTKFSEYALVLDVLPEKLVNSVSGLTCLTHFFSNHTFLEVSYVLSEQVENYAALLGNSLHLLSSE